MSEIAAGQLYRGWDGVRLLVIEVEDSQCYVLLVDTSEYYNDTRLVNWHLRSFKDGIAADNWTLVERAE